MKFAITSLTLIALLAVVFFIPGLERKISATVTVSGCKTLIISEAYEVDDHLAIVSHIYPDIQHRFINECFENVIYDSVTTTVNAWQERKHFVVAPYVRNQERMLEQLRNYNPDHTIVTDSAELEGLFDNGELVFDGRSQPVAELVNAPATGISDR